MGGPRGGGLEDVELRGVEPGVGVEGVRSPALNTRKREIDAAESAVAVSALQVLPVSVGKELYCSNFSIMRAC